MSRKEERVLEECKVIIERDFAPCGLQEDVEERIREIVQYWKGQKAEADKRGKTIGGLRIIFKDLLRARGLAEALSKRRGVPKCEYFRKWLSKPFTEHGGLGYYCTRFWEVGFLEDSGR